MKVTKNTKKAANAANAALNKSIESLDEMLSRFMEYYGKSLECLMNAATIYAKALNVYGDEARNAFEGHFPQLSKRDWDMLVKIARKELSPKVFVMSSGYMVKKIGALPYDVQVDVLGEVGEEPKPLPVLSRGSVVRKPMTLMNASEINSVIDTNAARVRTAKEQIAAAKAALELRALKPKWEVENGVLAVYKSCVIGGDDLVRLYNEIGALVKQMKKGRAA